MLRLTPFEGADADGGDSVFDEREVSLIANTRGDLQSHTSDD